MFGHKKTQLIAPVSGQIIPLSEVPDPTFAQGTVGYGFGVKTAGESVVSPVEGEIIMMFRTAHAFTVRTDSGVEVLVHVGIDTGKLDGEGFEAIAVRGDKVEAGAPVVRLNNLADLEAKVPSMITVVVVTNAKKVEPGELHLDASFGDPVLELK